MINNIKFSADKYTIKPPVCQGFCEIFVGLDKQAIVIKFYN